MIMCKYIYIYIYIYIALTIQLPLTKHTLYLNTMKQSLKNKELYYIVQIKYIMLKTTMSLTFTWCLSSRILKY